MSVVPQKTTPKPIFRPGVVIVVALGIVGTLFWIGNSALQNARHVASTTSPSPVASISPTPSDTDKKTMEALAQAQLINPTIQMDSIGDPELHVTVKNASSKAIDGIVISGSFKNNFGEPVTSFGDTDGFHANDQTTMQPGASKTDTWSLFGYTNATKISDIKVVRIHFIDGTNVQDPSYITN